MTFIPSKLFIGIAISALALSNVSLAEEKAAAEEVKADVKQEVNVDVKEQEQAQAPQIFMPVVAGAPVVRVGGGSRGSCGKLGENITLDAQPLTWSDTPSLQWSVSKPISGTFVLKIGESPNKNWDFVKPLVDKTLNLSVKEGIQKLSLAEYKAGLKEGVNYEWFLSLVCDENNRSKDIIVGGIIQR